MPSFNDFKILHSETIMFCQTIEHDIKVIYACMCAGNYSDNYEFILNKTLGQAIQILKKLDNEDGKPNISASDYNFLKQMTEKRNYWCHSSFVDFVYEENFENSNEYLKVCDKLINDHGKFEIIYRNVENIRLRMVDKYR